ncbi:MAG: winged helix-turn-helix domain-containing protein [Alphaproteobacteria bacterium]|nr:winged helix-turn-helix domain-containing protein [Alphaproteobacteria bacterium]
MPRIYCFEGFTLDLHRGSLTSADGEKALRPKSFSVLRHLVENAGRLVSKEELMSAIWPRVSVNEDSLARCISEVRLAIGDRQQRLIKTLPRRGYRFAVPVESHGELPPPEPATPTSPAARDGPIAGEASDRTVTERAMTVSPMPADGPPLLSDRPSIAVLPFQNLSGDAGREYFADGISDDIITTLSRIPNSLVIARNSSFSYKGRSVDVRQIGRDLGVRYLVDGSVQQAAGKSLRISCVLIDAGSGRHLWAERYHGSIDELFELQDRITSSIVATLVPKVSAAEIARAQAKPTSNLSAYDLHLRAWALLLNQHTESSLDQALALLHQAVTIDPQFSSAWALVAAVHWIRVANGWGGFRELQPLGLEAARRALETGNDNPLALTMGGFSIAYLGGKAEEGVGHIERALTLNPNYLVGWRFGGLAHAMLGEHEKAIEHLERAIQLSPLADDAFESYHYISLPCFFLGRYDQAVEWSDRALRDRPHLAPALVVKVAAVAMIGNRADELPGLVRQLLSLLPRMTIKGYRRRASMYQADDRELFERALRTAGVPE